jgi:hypothetical protein
LGQFHAVGPWHGGCFCPIHHAAETPNTEEHKMKTKTNTKAGVSMDPLPICKRF